MPRGRDVLLGLAGLSGIACFLTGLRYDAAGVAGAKDPFVDFIVTLAFLGAVGLLSAGLIQWRAAERSRLTLLIVQAVVAASYAAANAFGRIAGPFIVGPRRAPVRIHSIGLVLGSLMFIAAVVEAFLVSRPPASGDPT